MGRILSPVDFEIQRRHHEVCLLQAYEMRMIDQK
jgi:hypothetical protein